MSRLRDACLRDAAVRRARAGRHRHAQPARGAQRVRRGHGTRARRRLPPLRRGRRHPRRRRHRDAPGVLLRRRSRTRRRDVRQGRHHARSTPPGLRFPPWDVRKPVIGAINGHAIGVGMTLAIQCDLRFMAADAKYGVVQTQRGVMGDAFVHWSLPRIVGMANAAEILLTGRTFDGHDMQRLGCGEPRAAGRRGAAGGVGVRARDRRHHRADVGGVQQARAVGELRPRPRRGEPPRDGVAPPPDGQPRRQGRRDGVPRATDAPRWQGSVANDWPGQWPGQDVPGEEPA